jgi:hypothetical protein
MKTLINPQVTVAEDGKSATIVVQIVDAPFNGLLTTRTTHTHLNPDNMAHPRRIQSSNQAVFLEAPGVKVAMLNETIAAIFAAIEPKTTFAPVLKKEKDGTIKVLSETPVKLQWQVSDDGKAWTDVAGANARVMQSGDIKPGQWKRLVATNATGKFESRPVQIPTVK